MDLSTNDARLALAGKYAAKYGLDPAIVAAVCEQESSWNTWAIRFEPAFEVRYIHPALPAAPTTLELTKAMSFGLMQVMGEVAIEFGWQGRFLTQLCDPDIGVDIGCRKLQKCFSAHCDPEASLLAYNGGGNSFYGKQVLARVQHYETQQGAD
jgi:soluble lytic murein transglycosylase-like protein